MEMKTLEQLADETKQAKAQMERAKMAFYAKAGSYEAMYQAAERFCHCFSLYQYRKSGKRKRLDPRAVLR
jgi:hypothetical protein